MFTVEDYLTVEDGFNIEQVASSEINKRRYLQFTTNVKTLVLSVTFFLLLMCDNIT